MAETLSFGFIVPEDGDAANTWQPAIESSIRQLNDHTHDGANSATISPASLTTLTSTLASGASWTDLGNGNYQQDTSAPAAVTEVNNFAIQVYETSSGDRLNLSIERQGPTTLRFYSNNPVAMTVLYK